MFGLGKLNLIAKCYSFKAFLGGANGFGAGSHVEAEREVRFLPVVKLNFVNAQEIPPEILKDYSSRNTSAITFLQEEPVQTEYMHLRGS